MKLTTYYRSSAAYRVRIALNYKNIDHILIDTHLPSNAHKNEDHTALNPQNRVPTLIDDNVTLGQSMAILEYLEEKYPSPSLLPHNPQLRAQIRYFCGIIVADMHPLNNMSVLQYLRKQLGQAESAVNDWYHHWLKLGFDALEVLAKKAKSGPFCFGEAPTFADLCLIPQIYNANRFHFPMDNYPTLLAINAHCLEQPYFERALPENQTDFPK